MTVALQDVAREIDAMPNRTLRRSAFRAWAHELDMPSFEHFAAVLGHVLQREERTARAHGRELGLTEAGYRQLARGVRGGAAQPATQSPGGAPATMSAGMVPFADATYNYSEIMVTQVVTPGASGFDLTPVLIIPGGFLRGVTMIITSTGGSLGTGVASADNPFSLFNYLTLESIDGTPLKYPLNGYSYYLESRYCRPWDGDLALDPSFASGINPAFRVSFFIESRATLGVLPNTDARAQYRLRGNINPLSSANPAGGLLTTLGTATAPAVTISFLLETYAQPPAQSLSRVANQPNPDGLALQRFISHEASIPIGTGDNTIKSNRVGNLIRTLALVIRDVNGNRIDLTSDPIRLRVDNTQMFVEPRSRRDYEMFKFFQQQTAPGVVTSTRPTGVYVFPRWQDPGLMRGMGWLESTESTFLQFELIGGPSGGSLEIITEDYAPVAGLPVYLENI